jgi:hydroxyethylthiazole kinase-like uncharacterized protein yjeF
MRPMTLTVKQTRELDRRAQEDYGIPTLILMENAARTLAEVIQRFLISPIERCRVVIVCGTGNNGGDGLAAARHLLQRGTKSEVFLLGNESHMTEDAAVNFRIIKKLGIPVYPFSEFATRKSAWDRNPVLLIDALLGTGFKTPLRAELAGAIRQITDFKKHHIGTVRILAVDLPSGLNGDEGPNGNEAIPADVTVTLACFKPGLQKPESRPYVGRLECIDIGIPEELVRQVAG